MKRLILFLSFCVAFLSMFADSWVRINQLGYIPKTSKVAVYLSEEATEVSSFQLVDVFTGKVVYTSKAVKPMGALGGMKATYRLNFSDFTRQGTYRIVVNGCESLSGRFFHAGHRGGVPERSPFCRNCKRAAHHLLPGSPQYRICPG